MSVDFDVNTRIKELCQTRGLSYYKLAKLSGIPYSTLNTMLLKGNQPSLTTLRKICDGLSISMSQFFNLDDAPLDLTKAQKECLSLFNLLSSEKQTLALAYLKGLSQ